MENVKYEVTNNLRLPLISLVIAEIIHCQSHFHQEIELCIVLEGSIEVNSADGRNHYRKGDLVLFNSRQIHDVYSSELGNATVLVLKISTMLINQFFPEMTDIQFRCLDLTQSSAHGGNRKIVELLLTIAKDYFTAEPLFEFSCIANTCLVIRELLKSCSWTRISEEEQMAQNITTTRIQRIMDYIKAHYTERIFLSDLARLENVSMNYLSHYFREHVFMSFQEYNMLLRFAHARDLLMRTSMSLTDICFASGLQDSRQLKKIFLAQTGMTPQVYREKKPDIVCCKAKKNNIKWRETKQRLFEPDEARVYLDNNLVV